MVEKKFNSSIIFIILFIIALIIIIIMSYFIWQISTENTDLKNQVNQLSTNTNSFTTNSSTNNSSATNSTSSNTSNSDFPINYGSYTLKNDEIDLEQENYDIVSSISLNSNSKFGIDFNKGLDYYINGTYEISDNKIICTSELKTYVIGDAFGPTPNNYIFEFEILDSENLKLTKVPEDRFNLTVGETYSLDN